MAPSPGKRASPSVATTRNIRNLPQDDRLIDCTASSDRVIQFEISSEQVVAPAIARQAELIEMAQLGALNIPDVPGIG